MALEPILLDDLTWDGMTAAIRTRIAASSSNQWTLHAAVDPGVTLLELFAWLLEQRVYWMDQPSNALGRAALAMLGEAAQPARSAGTVLKFADVTTARPAPAGTEMRLSARGSSIVFTTSAGVLLLPVREISVSTDRNVTADLRHRLCPELFAASDEVRITLGVDGALPAGPQQQPLGLLIELDGPAEIRPQWHPSTVSGIDAAATITWHYRTTPGTTAPFPRTEDGTEGLRRSGVVRLTMPADWAPDGPADPGTGLTPYTITVRLEAGRYTYPPRLASLAVNVAVASHVRPSASHELELDWLPLPGHAIDTALLPPKSELKDHPPLDPDVFLELREGDGDWHPWKPVADLSFSGAGDRVFVVDRERGAFRFGDGLTGRVPVLLKGDGPNARFKYRVGGGAAGNLGSGLRWEQRDGPPAARLAATAVTAAEGGADAESVAQARTRTAALLSRVERGVIASDYEELATSTPGVAVARAHVAPGLHPCLPCLVVPGAVTVFIVPYAPRPAAADDDPAFTYVAAPAPDAATLAQVRKRLDAARLVGTEVYVVAARYRAVSLQVVVRADTPDPGALRQRLTRKMRAVLDPLGGTPSGLATAWRFGAALRPSALRKAAQAEIGRSGDVINVAIGLDGAPAGEDCKDVEIGPHDLPYLAGLDLALIASPSADGGLR
jgi:predicted phage baseplate assembly protein